MKNCLIKLLFFVIIPSTFFSCRKGDSNTIVLEHGWHFKLGDQKQWALPGTDDSKWDTAAVGHASAGKVFDNYHGYAWYRLNFYLPKSLSANKPLIKSDSVQFYFGAIDDCDEVYLNGYLIGTDNHNLPYGSMPDAGFTRAKDLWNVPRKYSLPIDDKRIKWDKKNLIAIRIFNQYGGGGIYSEIPNISQYGLRDYFSFDISDFYKVNDNDFVNRELVFKNKSALLQVKGTLLVTAINMETKQNIFDFQSIIKVSPQESRSVFIKLPVSTDPLKLNITFRDDITDQIIYMQDSIPYVLTP